MFQKLYILLIFIGTLLLNTAFAENRNVPLHYDLTVKLNVDSQEALVAGSVRLDKNTSEDTVALYLHKSVQIDYVKSNGNNLDYNVIDNSDIDYLPHAVVLQLPTQSLSKTIEFSYQLKLTDLPKYFPNVISKDWIEMGLYYPWFPYNPKFDKYTYDVNLNIGGNYNVFGPGDITKNQSNWLISQKTPTNDIVITAAPDMASFTYQYAQSKLIIHHSKAEEILAKNMAADMSEVVEGFTRWFGSAPNNIEIINSKRTDGGGYTRKGAIYLGGISTKTYLNKKEKYTRYFAHEIAHFWWNKADSTSWHDWLNESFAEYNALMFIRANCGLDEFTRRLEKKANNVAQLPALWEFDQNENIDRRKMLYDKGPVLLAKLEAKMGKTSFLKLFSNLIDMKENLTTQNFLLTLEKQEDKAIANWFESLLKTNIVTL